MAKGLKYLLLMLLLILGCSTEPEPEDCAGVTGGTAVEDNCGSCIGGTTNLTACTQDCAGVWGGYSVSDIDENCYATIQIGEQLWMAENLKTTKYKDGSYISSGHSDEEWDDLETGAYAVYDDDPSNAYIYGNLYNRFAVDDNRDVCPEDWHIPSDDEWAILTDYLGGESVAGAKMKSTGTIEDGEGLWKYYSDEITEGISNESGFTGIPAGCRSSNDGYFNIDRQGYFWSSSMLSSTDVWYHTLKYNISSIERKFQWSNKGGFSVRCLGD